MVVALLGLILPLTVVTPELPPDPLHEVAPLLAAPQASPRQAEIIDLLKKGQTDLAISKAREGVKEAPSSAAAHDLLGIALSAKAQWPEAEQEISEAIRLDPKREEPRLHLGQLFLAMNRPTEAVDQFEKTRDLFPQNGLVRRALAVAYVRQGRFRDAIRELEEGLRISQGKDQETKYLLAGLYHDTGRLADAEKLVGEVLASNPSFVPGQLLLAVLQVEQGRPDAAIPVLQDVIQKDPKSPWGHLALGMAYRMKGQLSEAVAELEQVTREQPKWALAHFQLGEAYLAQGDMDRAMKAYDQAEQASPDPSLMKLRVGQSLLQQGDTARALAKGEEVLRLGKATTQAHLLLARVHMARKAPDQAERELIAAMVEAPDTPTTGLVLATFYRETGKLDKAKATLTQIVSKFPDDAAGPYQLGLLAMMERKDREAVPLFERATKLQPAWSAPYAALAEARSRLGEHKEAVAAAERIVTLEGESAGALMRLGSIHERAGNFPAAEKAYQKALERDKNNLPAMLGLAGALDQEGKKADAYMAARAAATAHPRSPLPQLLLGRLQQGAGHEVEAVSAYRKALELDPENAVALNDLAWLLGKDGKNLGEAIALAEKAYGKAPNASPVMDTLGWLNYQQGNLDRAAELIKAALAGDPESTPIRSHLGMVYVRQGKTQEAIQEFHRIIKTSPQSPEAENARRMVKSLSSKK